MSRHLVIIGNGITGVTAARYVRKWRDDRITMVSDETDHFFSRTALMYLYMGHMRFPDIKPYEDAFWEKNRLDLRRGYVERIDPEARNLHFRDGGTLDYDVLLLATGAQSNKFGWPGQDLDGVQGLYGMPDLEAMERATAGINRAVVVGGGLIGIEMAEMLHSRHIPVTFLVREAGYMDYLLPPEESEIIHREIRRHHIDLRLGTELKEILPDAQGRTRAVVTSTGEEIPCQFVGLTVGVHPNIDLARASGVETNRGVLVNAFFETSVPGIYAAGDCAEFRDDGIGHRRIEQLWYSGRRHGKTVAQTLSGVRTAYDRGVFFNSAKFFTVEYQTYGDVPPTPREGEGTFVWQAEGKEALFRVAYALEDERVLGFNVMGLRLRHAVCERWILEKRTLPYVLAHLRDASFEPEFFRPFERDVLAAYNRRRPGEQLLASRSGGLLGRLLFGKTG